MSSTTHFFRFSNTNKRLCSRVFLFFLYLTKRTLISSSEPQETTKGEYNHLELTPSTEPPPLTHSLDSLPVARWLSSLYFNRFVHRIQCVILRKFSRTNLLLPTSIPPILNLIPFTILIFCFLWILRYYFAFLQSFPFFSYFHSLSLALSLSLFCFVGCLYITYVLCVCVSDFFLNYRSYYYYYFYARRAFAIQISFCRLHTSLYLSSYHFRSLFFRYIFFWKLSLNAFDCVTCFVVEFVVHLLFHSEDVICIYDLPCSTQHFFLCIICFFPLFSPIQMHGTFS